MIKLKKKIARNINSKMQLSKLVIIDIIILQRKTILKLEKKIKRYKNYR